MRKIIPLFIFLVVAANGTKIFALDPVTPRSERAFGFIKVESPLPDSDSCELTGKNKFKQNFKPGEMIKVPIGEYDLEVKLQDGKWTSPVQIGPSEYTKVVVTGYGNLKVNSPNPESDKIEVYSQEGKLVEDFHPSKLKTLPTGTYNVKVKIGKASTTQNDVVIVTNTTRELDVSAGN